MLVWINGPFGGGKTQTAHELRRRLPGSVVCDPEEVGFGLHRMMPPSMREDFQDMSAWRQGVYEVLDLVLHHHDGPVIAPMTLVDAAYFEDIIGGLQQRGHHVRHFSLLADRHTVLKRIRGRGLGLLPDRFATSRVDSYLERLSRPEFAEHVWTDRITIPEVAERIAASAGLALLETRDAPLRGRMRRAVTAVQHLRHL